MNLRHRAEKLSQLSDDFWQLQIWDPRIEGIAGGLIRRNLFETSATRSLTYSIETGDRFGSSAGVRFSLPAGAP